MERDDNIFLNFTDVFESTCFGTIDNIQVDYVSVDSLEYKAVGVSVNGKESWSDYCEIKPDELPVYDGT